MYAGRATLEFLPELSIDAVYLREVHLSDAAALTALFARPEVAAHLDPPPATSEDFGAWISVSRLRREERKAACYTLLNRRHEVCGLFMALRMDPDDRAEIGFAISPALWGTGIFVKIATVYLDFLFNEWGVNTLVGKTLVRNTRGVGAMRKLGGTVIEQADRNGNPEFVWTIEKPPVRG